jgi:hypothetical protein
MKTLKMNLENIQGKLSRTELRKVMAGSDASSGYLTCSCTSGANPPFASTWTKLYETVAEISSDLSRACVDGLGRCVATKSY